MLNELCTHLIKECPHTEIKFIQITAFSYIGVIIQTDKCQLFASLTMVMKNE